ncbi:MAG: EAL domain-containing protein [Actinomycetia bacterium]|nr:EAL domain-containing protein [Actinomycetes bacterium]
MPVVVARERPLPDLVIRVSGNARVRQIWGDPSEYDLRPDASPGELSKLLSRFGAHGIDEIVRTVVRSRQAMVSTADIPVGGRVRPIRAAIVPGAGGDAVCVLADLSAFATDHRQYDLLASIARGGEPSENLAGIVDLLGGHGGRRGATVLVLSDDGDRLDESLPAGGVEVHSGFAADLSHSLPWVTAARSGRRVTVTDVASDLRFADLGEIVAEYPEMGAVMVEPVVATGDNAVLGAVVVWAPLVEDLPEAADVELAAVLAGIALERQSADAALVYRATHDLLTGVSNRAALIDRLDRALADDSRREHPVALLFCDLDGFKAINDLYGHHVGDLALVDVARRLVEAVRPGDTVARYGGDEFVVLCEEVDGAEGAMMIADRLVEAVRERPLDIDDDIEVALDISVGIRVSGDAETNESMLRDADSAMYRAKAEGGATARVYGEAVRRSVRHRAQLAEELRVGIDTRQLRLRYQPIMDLTSDRVVAVEALVRWAHPSRGLLVADGFVPLAEATGLILPLGEVVLAQALEDLVVWDEQGIDPPVGLQVNVSSQQLQAPGFSESVLAIVDSFEVDRQRICLEITETSLLEESDESTAALETLVEGGIVLALDDFGTGYSSLTTLQRVPVSRLKIDGSFVGGLGINPSDEAIVRSVVNLAGSLELTAVAEGVEVAGQMEYLRDLGCEWAQGILFSPPLDSPTLVSQLTRMQRRYLD